MPFPTAQPPPYIDIHVQYILSQGEMTVHHIPLQEHGRTGDQGHHETARAQLHLAGAVLVAFLLVLALGFISIARTTSRGGFAASGRRAGVRGGGGRARGGGARGRAAGGGLVFVVAGILVFVIAGKLAVAVAGADQGVLAESAVVAAAYITFWGCNCGREYNVSVCNI
jgi:hypothetical protein